MGWTTGVQFPAGAVTGYFLFAIASRPALGPTQPSNQWVPVAFTPLVKRSGLEATPLRLHDVVLSSAQGQLYPYSKGYIDGLS